MDYHQQDRWVRHHSAVVHDALSSGGESILLQNLCERLVVDGLPLKRVNLAHTTIHPVFLGHDFEWWRDQGDARTGDWNRGAFPEVIDDFAYPFLYMSRHGVPEMRKNLAAGEGQEFPLLRQLKSQGITDYWAAATDFESQHQSGPFSGFTTSWATDAAGGMADSDIELIRHLLPTLGLASLATTSYQVAKGLLATYIGPDAGQRVLSGEIQRGSVDVIRAVIWTCDLSGFTRIADTSPPATLIPLLNDYFECFVEHLHTRQGQVLKFLGDGLLAIFRLEEDPAAVVQRALEATREMRAEIRRLNARRLADGLATTEFTAAIHLGEVLYGNFGGRDRLDFTVVGPAVNEAARIQAMCGPLEQRILVSSAVAHVAGAVDDLVSLGRYALRGVSRPQELFALLPNQQD